MFCNFVEDNIFSRILQGYSIELYKIKDFIINVYNILGESLGKLKII